MLSRRAKPPLHELYSAHFFAFELKVDDYVCDGNREAFAGTGDDAALEPVRAAIGVRRDDDLVRAEGSKGVLDRLQRLAVADLTAGVHTGLAQAREAAVEAVLSRRARLVLVGHPVLERRVQ